MLVKRKDEVKKSKSRVVVSFARFGGARPNVIPAKAGIQYVRRSVAKVCGVDSRLRGNDVRLGRPCCSNNTSTRIREVKKSRVECQSAVEPQPGVLTPRLLDCRLWTPRLLDFSTSRLPRLSEV